VTPYERLEVAATSALMEVFHYRRTYKEYAYYRYDCENDDLCRNTVGYQRRYQAADASYCETKDEEVAVRKLEYQAQDAYYQPYLP
jgi:hypothetical protein